MRCGLADVCGPRCLGSHRMATRSSLQSCKQVLCCDVGCNQVLLVVIDSLAAWFLIWCCKTACPHGVRASLSDGFLSAMFSLPSSFVPQQLLVHHCVVSYLCACWQCFQVVSLSSVLLSYNFIGVLTSCLVTKEEVRQEGSHHAILCVQPSISFEQQVASQGLVSLQFGQQVIPAPTDRRSSDRRSPQGKGASTDEVLQTRYLLPSAMTLALTCVPLTACLLPL